MTKKYPSKILLFGEYAVLSGADAIAIPYAGLYGEWVRSPRLEAAPSLQMNLRELGAHLSGLTQKLPRFKMDTAAFDAALGEGWFFRSNIPQGYGVGSSGALCAAVYDQFTGARTNDLGTLKYFFSRMEGFFHGTSSGFDPLVSYLGQAIRIRGGEMEVLPGTSSAPGLFLLDTGRKRQAERLISIFLKKCESSDYLEGIRQKLIPLTSRAIGSYLRADTTSLFHQMHDISRFQYLHFREMIPEDLLPYWEKGLRSSHFKLKVCGAGGGGFLLGLSSDWERTQALLQDWDLVLL